MDTQPIDCESTKAECLCNRPHGHEGPHECNCAGSWDDDGEVLAFPEMSPVKAGTYSDNLEPIDP